LEDKILLSLIYKEDLM